MEDEIIDYASLSDAELSPIIYNLLNQGLSEAEVKQKLWGPSIDDPSNNNISPNWENILSTNPALANVISEEPRVDGFLGADLLNPTKKIDRTLTIPSYKKKINQMAYWPGSPSKNEAFENQLRTNGDITGDETIIDYFEKNGWEKSFDKNVDGYSMEIWKDWKEMSEQTITEDEYNRQEGIYEGYDLIGYKNELSFEEYAEAWDVKIGENIRDFDPKFSDRQKKEINKIQIGLRDIGNITDTSEEFLNILPTNGAIDVEDEFFKVIRDTGELLDLDEDSTKDEIQTADFTERDVQIVAMFGDDKGQEMINYLNNNPQEYLNMIDANPLFGEGFSNLSGALGDDGESPGGYWDTIEKQNTTGFLTSMGVIQQKEKTQGGSGFNTPEYLITPKYQAWLQSENGLAQRYKLLQDYKSNKIRKFLNDNDLGNTYFTGEWGEGFRRVIGRDRDGSGLYGYSSEAVLLGTPENQQIYDDNRKTQAEFIKAAEEINYTGFGRGFGGSLTLKLGEPVTLDSPKWAKPRTFHLKPYQQPTGGQEYIDKTSQVISDVADTEIAKYDLINEKATPYFKAIEDANTALEFFDTQDEWGQAYPGGINPSQREAYVEIIKQKNKAITNLTESGLFESLNDQASILKGLEEVNDVFFDQAEVLGNVAMMTAAAIKNPSNWARAANAFARTAMEFTLKLEEVAIDVEEILTPETMEIVMNTPFFAADMTSMLAATIGDKLDNSPSEEYKAKKQIVLDQYEKFTKEAADEFAPKIDYKTMLPGEWGNYVQQTLAESAPTLAMVMGPSLIARLGTKSFVKASVDKVIKDMTRAGAAKSTINLTANSNYLKSKFAQRIMNRASTASMGMFIGSSWGSRGMQLEFQFANAPERIKQIKEMLEVMPAENTSGRLELLSMLNNSENILNTPKHLREWDAISYGLIDGFSERLGTLSILNKARRMGKSWKNLTRGEKFTRVGTGALGAGKSMLVEVSEEIAAQLGHNLADKVLLGDNKSIFDGIDSNLIADSVVNIVAMQTPAYAGNVLRAIRDEVTTFKDKQAQAKIGKQLRGLKTKLKITKDPKKRKELISEIDTLMQKASIAEFNSFQRFRNLTTEEIDELVELGGKKSKAAARYLEHMRMMPDGKNTRQMSKWQKETKHLQAQLTTLRNQQGEILNTAEWKRYQNYTKTANEYHQLNVKSRELELENKLTEHDKIDLVTKELEQEFRAQEVEADLKKSFTGAKIDQKDNVSVLPKEIRNAEYQAYDAIRDMVTNYGDVRTQNNSTYLQTTQDVRDYQIENNC